MIEEENPILETQSDPGSRYPRITASQPIETAAREGRGIREAVEQVMGVTAGAQVGGDPGGSVGDPGDKSSDEDQGGGGSEPGGRGARQAGAAAPAPATKPSASDRRQMFKMVQSYYKADSEKFHGRDEENIEEFLETYESLFTVAGMPKSLAVDLIPYVLAESAKDYFRMIPKRERSHWSALRLKLSKHYASAARRQRLSQLYQSLRQLTAQGLEPYYRLLVEISRQLPEAYRQDDLLRDKFISGLHESIKEKVVLVDPPNLQAAYDRAKLVVQARSAIRGPIRVPRNAPWRPVGRLAPRPRRGFINAVAPANRARPGARRVAGPRSAANVVCWHCGETGHYQSAHQNQGAPRPNARRAQGN